MMTSPRSSAVSPPCTRGALTQRRTGATADAAGVAEAAGPESEDAAAATGGAGGAAWDALVSHNRLRKIVRKTRELIRTGPSKSDAMKYRFQGIG